MPRGIANLHSLARMHGVQTAYYDVSHRRRAASVMVTSTSAASINSSNTKR